MASKTETTRTTTKKKSSGGGGGSALRNVMASGAAADTLIDLVQRLGLVDIVLGRVKSRIEETDIDELLDDVTDYLRRNPEVLVVSLGAVTIATGLLVWLNTRREWDGNERRGSGSSSTGGGNARTTGSTAAGRARRTSTTSSARSDED
jgi:hypothetical protein